MNENAVPKTLSPDTLRALMGYDWPGNVRQLENTINRAMVISDGNVLQIDNIPSLAGIDMEHSVSMQKSSVSNLIIEIMHSDGSFKTVENIEQEAIQRALDHYDHNITQAAKALGIAKSTFYKKLKKIEA